MSKERRTTRRRPILDSFSFFVVLPKNGDHRLRVYDVSEGGVGFDFDAGGESPQDFPVKMGDTMDLHFYLNQSLYLPLQVSVKRIDEKGGVRRIGAEFKDTQGAGFKALSGFLAMLDQISEAAQIDS